MDQLSYQCRQQINELLVGTVNSILRIEEQALKTSFTVDLTITEVHTIAAIGLHDSCPMKVVAARLSVTLATLTTAVGRLVDKGFVQRLRSKEDKRIVLVSLTKQGREVWRVHHLFHKNMIDNVLTELSFEEKQVLVKALGKAKTYFSQQEKGS